MFGGTLKRDFNLSSKEYRGSPPWKMSLHPEIRDKACARRLMYRGNRNISWVGLGDFNNSVSTPGASWKCHRKYKWLALCWHRLGGSGCGQLCSSPSPRPSLSSTRRRQSFSKVSPKTKKLLMIGTKNNCQMSNRISNISINTNPQFHKLQTCSSIS